LFSIILNGQERKTARKVVRYSELVGMLYGGYTRAIELQTITFYNGPRENKEGTLIPKQLSVKLKNGMVFTCVNTGRA